MLRLNLVGLRTEQVLGFLKIGLASGLNRMSSEKSFRQPNVDSNKVGNSPHN